MKVIGHRAGQSIAIGSDIVVRVLSIRGKWIRVAVEAPKDVVVISQTREQRDDMDAMVIPAADSTQTGM